MAAQHGVLKRDLSQLQKDLDAKKIPLNCTNPPYQNQLNHLQWDQINAYLDYLQKKDPATTLCLREFFKTGIDKVTVDELETHLATCMTFLNKELDDFEIGFIPKKSSEWIASKALGYLAKSPTAHFTHTSDKGGSQSPLTSKSRTFVICDDCSYSGKQLYTLIRGMQGELCSQGKKAKLYLVVPFISSTAEKFLTHQLKELFKCKERESRSLKVHLITSQRPLKIVADLDPSKQDHSGISFTEWKVPDTTSLAAFATAGLMEDASGKVIIANFLTDFPPCYK